MEVILIRYGIYIPISINIRRYTENIYTGLATATITIFIRCVFRVAELKGGFDSELANNEIAFMILEGAMIVIACVCMTAFHPGYCFGGKWGKTEWRAKSKHDSELGYEGAPLKDPGSGSRND